MPGSGTANLTSSNSLTYDAFVSKLDSNGAYVWARKVGNTGSFPALGNAVAFDDSGDVYMGGNFGGLVDFDPGSATANLFSASQNGYVFKWQDSVATTTPPLNVGGTMLSRGITVAPVPASNSIVIRCSNASLLGREAMVYSMQGRLNCALPAGCDYQDRCSNLGIGCLLSALT